MNTKVIASNIDNTYYNFLNAQTNYFFSVTPQQQAHILIGMERTAIAELENTYNESIPDDNVLMFVDDLLDYLNEAAHGRFSDKTTDKLYELRQKYDPSIDHHEIETLVDIINKQVFKWLKFYTDRRQAFRLPELDSNKDAIFKTIEENSEINIIRFVARAIDIVRHRD